MTHQCKFKETAIAAYLRKNNDAILQAKVMGLELISCNFIPDVSANEICWRDADGVVHYHQEIVELSSCEKGLFIAFLEGGQPLPAYLAIIDKTKVDDDLFQVVVDVHGVKHMFQWIKGAHKFPKALTKAQCEKVDLHLRFGNACPLPKSIVLHDSNRLDDERPDLLDVAIQVNGSLHLFKWQQDLGCFASYSRAHERHYRRSNTPVVFGKRS